MIQDKNNPKHWTADEGKVFKRINHEDIMGQDLWLGYSYYIDGKKLDEKHLDVIEEFEEIDMPEDRESCDTTLQTNINTLSSSTDTKIARETNGYRLDIYIKEN